MAIDKCGREPQFRQLQEECSELAVASSHYMRKCDGAKEEMIEELADVCICVRQVIEMLQCENEFYEAIDMKINRLERRLRGYPM